MKRSLMVLTVIITLFILGCVRPYPIYDLIPAEEHTTRWLFGNEYAILSQDGIIASIAFDRSERDLLVFDMEVINESDTNALIAPEMFYYIPHNSGSEEIEVLAIDPEIQLLRLDKALSRERASLSNQEMSNFLVDTADLIGDIALSDRRTIQEEQLDTEQDLKRQVEDDREEERTRYQITSLDQQRKYWSTQVLRKTTLKSGDVIRGKVFFPAQKTTKKLLAIFPIETTEFKLEFNQIKY